MEPWTHLRIVSKSDRVSIQLNKFYYVSKKNRELSNRQLLPKVGFIGDWNSFPAMVGQYTEQLALFEIWKLISCLQNKGELGKNDATDYAAVTFSSPKNALDIGAHIGNHSLFFSQYFNAVYAFEPDPTTFELLKINSDGHNIVAYPFGISDHNGSSGFVVNHESRGKSYLDDARGGDKVNVRALDAIQDLLGDISLIKIDAEGHEYQVLKGGRLLIIKNHPIILFEWNKLNGQDYDDRVVDYLTVLGYEFYYFIHPARPRNKLKRIIYYYRKFITGQITYWTKSSVLPRKDINLVVAIYSE